MTRQGNRIRRKKIVALKKRSVQIFCPKKNKKAEGSNS